MYICIYHSYLRVKHPLANVDDIRPQFQVDNDLVTDETGVFNSTTVRDIAVPVNATIEALDQIPLSEVQGFKALALPWYTDQVLPFDVTIACANEYGAAASSKIFGIEILNEGFGTSIDDSVIEQQATLLAGRRRLFTRSGGNNYQGIDVGRNRNFPRAPAPSPGCQRPDPALPELQDSPGGPQPTATGGPPSALCPQPSDFRKMGRLGEQSRFEKCGWVR